MKSMTGFGAGAAEDGPTRVEVQIRSVNGRFGEVRFKMPPELTPHEAELRKAVTAVVLRGRADVWISIRTDDPPPVEVRLNRPLASHYLESADTLKREFGLAGSVDLPTLLGVPGLMELQAPGAGSAGEPVLELVRRALASALAAHDAVRAAEGARLKSDLEARLGEIETLRAGIAKKASAVPETARDKLSERIRRLTAGTGVDRQLDPGRLEQEVAYLADRSDITEELVRLEAHLQAGRELLGNADPAGKKLEFLLQEIGRETNTIGSKASDLDITRLALAIKAEVEKLREQVLNLE